MRKKEGTAMRLSNKVAIVTGSSRGIGKAIAIGFAREGADIVVAARSEVENEKVPGTIYKTAQEIEALGRRALPIKTDISDEQSINQMVQKAIDKFGRIDILVNNAAMAWYPSFMETSLADWELVLRTSLTGPFICIKAVLPLMVKQRSGNILNISSGAAEVRVRKFTGIAYGVSKAGLDHLTVRLAAEVGQYNIAVNCLKPDKAIASEGMRARNPKADYSQWDLRSRW
jgi:citronellol/citronellal dehydrogenase